VLCCLSHAPNLRKLLSILLAVLGFKLRVLHLQGRCFTTWATPSPRKLFLSSKVSPRNKQDENILFIHLGDIPEMCSC
jgi:hypothetical protein